MQILAQSTSHSHSHGAGSRIPWVAAGVVTLLFGVVAAFGTVQDTLEPVFASTVVEPLTLPATLEDNDAAKVFFREERFQRGDTISTLLERLEVDDQQAERLLRSREATRPFRLLRPGTTVQARTAEDGSLLSMWFIGGRDHITTMMKARSSLGRSFIEVCKCAGWGDVGYINRWTMEITNNSRFFSIPLVVGRRVAQMVFYEVAPLAKNQIDYVGEGGKYQRSQDVEEVKRTWHPQMMLPRMHHDWEIESGL